MSLVYLFAGFIAGILFGVTAAFLILRWKLNRQLGNFQSEMEDMMEMTGEMGEAFEEMDIEMSDEEFEKEEREN